MAKGGKKLGNIYVELGLDSAEFTKGEAKILQSAQSTSLLMEKNWRELGSHSDRIFNAMRDNVVNAQNSILNNTKTTADERARVERAAAEKIKAINEQQFGHQTTMLEGLKKNWIAASAAIGAAMLAMNRAMAYMEEGAKALRVESSFKIMAEAAGVNSEKLIASMRAATKETVEDSDMMQKAVKLMTLGYNPEQIERFSKVVITASQIAGTTSAEAYDALADAIANRMPKALVRMGAVTKEQMKIVNAAIESGADSTKLYELAMANLEMKQLMLQGTQDGATIAMQRFQAQIKETKEELGKGIIVLAEKLYGVLQAVAAAALAASGGLFTLISHLPGTDKAKWKGEATAAFGAGEALAFKSNDNLFGASTSESKASSDALKTAQDRINSLMKEMNAIINKGTASKKAAAEQEAATKKVLEATRKATYELESVGQSQYEKDVARIKSEAEQYRKSGVNKIAVAKWVATETALADAKNTQEMFKSWRSEENKAIEAMQAEAEAGAKLSEERIRDRDKFNEFAKESADNLLSVEDHAIQDLMDAETKKFDYLKKLELEGVITHKEAEDEKRKYTEKRIKSEKEIESEKWVKANAEQQQVFSNLATCFDMASQLYAEDSKERQALSEAAKIATMAEIALQVQKNLMIAVGAVVNQGTGDPYTAFARIAAMIAVVTGVLSIAGIAFGGGGAGASASTGPSYTGTSSVLGANDDVQSESISKSWEMMQDTYDMEDTKLTKIYNELRSLNSNITGLVSSYFRTGSSDTSWSTAPSNENFWSLTSSFDRAASIISAEKVTEKIFGDSAIGKFLDLPAQLGTKWIVSLSNALFGGDIDVSLEKGGIELGDVILKDVMNGLKVSAKRYATYKIEEDGGWFGDDETSWETKYAELNDDVVDMLTKVFDSLGGSLVELAKGLGTDVEAVYNYVFETAQLNLKDMNADEMSKALTTYFSDMADIAVEDLFGPIIKQFQHLNEALYQTAVRLIQNKEIISNLLSLTGTSFNGMYLEVERTRQVYTEAWKEWNLQYLATSDTLSGAIERWILKRHEPTKYMTETYKELASTNEQIFAFDEALIALAGDLETLTDQVSTYYDAFFSDAEKQERATTTLTTQMKMLNEAFELPSTRSGYRAMIEAIDLSTEAGMKQWYTMIQMAGIADQYYSYLEDALDDVINKQQDYVDSLKSISDAITDWLDSLKLSDLAPVGSEAEWTRQYDQARTKAMATGASEQDISGYLDFASKYLTYEKSYGTDQSYQAIYDSIVADAESLKAQTDAMVPIAEQQLNYLKQIAENTSSTSSDANAAINIAILNQIAAANEQARLIAEAAGTQAMMEAQAQANAQAAADAAAIEAAKAEAADLTPFEQLQTDIKEGLSNLFGRLFGTPHAAVGGLTSGITIAGESGPEWVVPTYEPQRSSFLKTVGADPETIGRIISEAIRKNIGVSSPSGGGDIHVSVQIDGREIGNVVAKQVKTNSDLQESIRRAA